MLSTDCVHVCVQHNQNMKLDRSSWSTTIFTVLFAAVLPMHVWTYNVLFIPFFGKSHIYSLVAMAEGLVNRGHNVTLFVGDNFRFNVPELSNRKKMSVVRYGDTVDGEYLDYETMFDDVTKSHIELDSGGKQHRVSFLNKVYVHFIQWDLNEIEIICDKDIFLQLQSLQRVF